MGINGTKFSQKSFQKIQKLLNAQEAVHSTENSSGNSRKFRYTSHASGNAGKWKFFSGYWKPEFVIEWIVPTLNYAVEANIVKKESCIVNCHPCLAWDQWNIVTHDEEDRPETRLLCWMLLTMLLLVVCSFTSMDRCAAEEHRCDREWNCGAPVSRSRKSYAYNNLAKEWSKYQLRQQPSLFPEEHWLIAD